MQPHSAFQKPSIQKILETAQVCLTQANSAAHACWRLSTLLNIIQTTSLGFCNNCHTLDCLYGLPHWLVPLRGCFKGPSQLKSGFALAQEQKFTILKHCALSSLWIRDQGDKMSPPLCCIRDLGSITMALRFYLVIYTSLPWTGTERHTVPVYDRKRVGVKGWLDFRSMFVYTILYIDIRISSRIYDDWPRFPFRVPDTRLLIHEPISGCSRVFEICTPRR